MGVQGLMTLVAQEVPDAVKTVPMSSLTGRKVAIDASMAMYQFLVAVRTGGGGEGGRVAQMLTNEAGEVTSHIQGMFNRTIRMMSNGIKPVYVFDGKAPPIKGAELGKRMAKRREAEKDLKDAQMQDASAEDLEKFSKRLVKVTPQHNEDCKTLLRLMGVPVVEALSEAEAQCAELAKAGVVYATATEDADALTFRTPMLLRQLAYPTQQTTANNCFQIAYADVVRGLGLTDQQFVDMCILCGCDYAERIRGVGPKSALNLIRQHGSIEAALKHLQGGKYDIPADWLQPVRRKGGETQAAGEVHETELRDEDLDQLEQIPTYKMARLVFLNPAVHPASNFELKWTDPDEEGLTKFLVDRLQFNPERVAQGIKKLKEARKQKQGQTRVDSFFKVVSPPPGGAAKRRPDPVKQKKPQGPPAKKAKTGS